VFLADDQANAQGGTGASYSHGPPASACGQKRMPVMAVVVVRGRLVRFQKWHTPHQRPLERGHSQHGWDIQRKYCWIVVMFFDWHVMRMCVLSGVCKTEKNSCYSWDDLWRNRLVCVCSASQFNDLGDSHGKRFQIFMVPPPTPFPCSYSNGTALKYKI
jgi:hypothetical protein